MAMGDCDKAIKICEKAVTDIHLQSFDQTSVLHNMSSVLHARFKKLKIQVSEKVKALPCSNITSWTIILHKVGNQDTVNLSWGES